MEGSVTQAGSGCKGGRQDYIPPIFRPEQIPPRASKMNLNDPLVSTLVPLVLLFGIFYFLLIRPQQQRVKTHQQMVESVRRGDTVVTAGGLIGKVSKVKDDGELMVEIADNVQVRVLKSTLTEVRTKGTEKAET
jgi:preprotein translocase subunit YajC